MAQQRVYICPDHPDKTYTSWRKFRGHWSTLHRGEQVGERDEYLHMVDKEEVQEEKAERREEKKERAEGAAAIGADGLLEHETFLPEEPVPRLMKILQVHGVEESTIHTILAIFQLHSAFRENPANLYYLLTSKLPRKMHSSVPMIVSAFVTQEPSYPEGSPMGLFPGAPQTGGGTPFIMGGMNPMNYGGTYGWPSYVYPPMGGRFPPEHEDEKKAPRESNPVEDIVALLGTIMKIPELVGGGKREGEPTVQEVFEGFKETISEITASSEKITERVLQQMEEAEKARERDREAMKDELTKLRLEGKDAEIERLREEREDEQSEGLGTLVREAGEGLAAQAEGLRNSVSRGLDKLSDTVEKVVSTEGAVVGSMLERRGQSKKPRSVSEAADVVRAEAELAALVEEASSGGGQIGNT